MDYANYFIVVSQCAVLSSIIRFIHRAPPSAAISTAPSYSHDWTQFANESSTILKTVKAAIRLQQNAWLLPAENTLPVLMALGASAHHHNLSYSALLIQDGSVVLALDIKPNP